MTIKIAPSDVPRGFKRRPDEIYLVYICPCCQSPVVQVVSRKASKWLSKEFKSKHNTKLQPIESEMPLRSLKEIKGMPEYDAIVKEVQRKIGAK